MLLNETAVYSITRRYQSIQIIYHMKKILGNLSKLVITDATACVGGDTVKFSNEFKFVNSVEILYDTFKILNRNCKYITNVRLINDDYLNIKDTLNQDVIYIDPPWGGKGYKNNVIVNLKLSEINISDIVNSLQGHIFLKVPINANISDIKPTKKIKIFNKRDKVSFYLLYIKK